MKRSWGWITALGVPFGLVMGAIAAWPKVTVADKEPLRPLDMLSTPFTVVNEGPIPIEDVSLICQVDSLETSLGQEILNVRMAPQQLIGELAPGEAVTGWCYVPNFTGNVIGTAGRQQIVRLTLEVSYRPYGVPRTSRASAGFRTAPGSDHRLHWTRARAIRIWRPI